MKDTKFEREYAAFISYRHVYPDKLIAKVLQFLLEYNLVRPNKQVPRRIRPVFLDTSELPTSEDLDADILHALDHSHCLFVICSPDLPQSKYCMREISYFKEIHGGSLHQIATLLVRGTPSEAYPLSLQTKTIPDPENPDNTIDTYVEPLYADIRANTLIGSLWKLFSSEYLRLACRYFHCSYDSLKKRHKRNAIAFASLTLMLAAGITGTFIHKEHQVQKTISDAFAAHANEQTHAGNEFLALALCTADDYRDTSAYHTALRNAVVQLDYKQRHIPAAKLLEIPYYHNDYSNYFLSSTENKLVVADGNIWQIIDSHNGALLQQLPYESAFVLGNKPSSYVMIQSQPDQNGIFWDYVILTDLETDQIITQFAFRPSSGDIPQYQVITDIETAQLHLLTDHGKPVAYFTSAGLPLTQEEYISQAQQVQATTSPELHSPYVLVKDKRLGCMVVKDSTGTILLTLGETYQAAAFSDDTLLFACASHDTLTVYDTQHWKPLSTISLEPMSLQQLQLLSDSHYYIASYRNGPSTISYVCDWRSNEILLTTDAPIITATSEPSFYTVLDGMLCRYQYVDVENNQRLPVVAHSGSRCISGVSGNYTLQDTENREIILQTDARRISTDESVQTLLLALPETLECYDGNGTLLWQLSAESQQEIVSPDGSCVAWMDSRGNIQVHLRDDGSLLWQVPRTQTSPAGTIHTFVCSPQGVGVFGSFGAFWIPKQSGAPISLGAFSHGTLFSDGMLIIESQARVNDFRLYDTKNDVLFSPAAENTGQWAYSPHTGYLVRHLEASGNKPSLSLEIWKRKGNDVSFYSTVDLTHTQVDALSLDSTGQYLNLVCQGQTQIYQLNSMTNVLDVSGLIYYEADVLYSWQLYGQKQYQIPMYDVPTLHQWAQTMLTSPVSVRTLTAEEAKQYSVTP